jgi:hypothetical protein
MDECLSALNGFILKQFGLEISKNQNILGDNFPNFVNFVNFAQNNDINNRVLEYSSIHMNHDDAIFHPFQPHEWR